MAVQTQDKASSGKGSHSHLLIPGKDLKGHKCDLPPSLTASNCAEMGLCLYWIQFSLGVDLETAGCDLWYRECSRIPLTSAEHLCISLGNLDLFSICEHRMFLLLCISIWSCTLHSSTLEKELSFMSPLVCKWIFKHRKTFIGCYEKSLTSMGTPPSRTKKTVYEPNSLHSCTP